MSGLHTCHKNILSVKVGICFIACNITCYITCDILAAAGCICLCRETAISNSPRSSPGKLGKESLNINLLKAERHLAVSLADHGLLQCDEDVAP